MRVRHPWPIWLPTSAALVALAIAAAPARGQPSSSTSSSKDHKDQSKDDAVVRTFGGQGGFRTEVTSKTHGKLTQEDLRQASLLVAEVFQHIEKARQDLDADDTKEALKEVNKAREAVKAIRSMLPETDVHTKTVAPDGKTIYEDDCEIREGRIPLYEGLLHRETLAPILAARKNALQVAGYHVVDAEEVATEAIADLDPIEAGLTRTAKALEQNKADEAAKALTIALVRGVDFRFSKQDSELAAARDAIWLARRALEENNIPQALVNLADSRRRLATYREILPADQRKDVDQMLAEVDELENQLRQEGTQQVSQSTRASQGRKLTHWWDRVNSWFRRHF
jgi:hypothetical protein